MNKHEQPEILTVTNEDNNGPNEPENPNNLKRIKEIIKVIQNKLAINSIDKFSMNSFDYLF